MSTRADFYAGTGAAAVWLGCMAFDGYPAGMPQALLHADTEDTYRQAVAKLLTTRGDGRLATQGPWPWPWTSSERTRYAYTFDAELGAVVASYYGSPWFAAARLPLADECGPRFAVNGARAVFPTMQAAQVR